MSHTRNTSFIHQLLTSLLLLPLLTPAAQAMSYVPMADSPLLSQADLVVLGEVNTITPAPGNELSATRYSLGIEQVIKGAPGAQAISILVPGAADPTLNGALSIPGMPRIVAGERVLAFLDRRDSGDYVLVHLSLGAFHVRQTTSGSEVLVRDLEQADALDQMTDATAASMTRLRDLGKFTGWLRQAAAGQAPAAAYWNDEALAPPNLVQPRYVVSAPPARWFGFDNGGSVPFYASSVGQIGLLDGGYGEFQKAIAAWNNNGVAKVNYAYAGLTSATGDLNHPDGVNKILFNDLTNFIGGVFDCVTGGVAGYGGWRSGSTQTYNGSSFQSITEGDVVIRNGAGCLLSGNANANAVELFGHELGHTLGLGHPCGDSGQAACVTGTPQDDALMRPYIHADGRGARLGSDDLAGIAFLYPLTSGTGTGSGPTGSGGTNGNSTGAGSSGGGGGSFDPLAGMLLLLALGCRGIRVQGATRPVRG